MEKMALFLLLTAVLTYLSYKAYLFLSGGDISPCCCSNNCPWKDHCRSTTK